MFNWKHYVPVLRWRCAEKEALGKLEIERKRTITPLIEIMMKPNFESLEETIADLKISVPKVPDEILKFWGNETIFVDLGLIDVSLRAWGLDVIMSLGEKINITPVPVVSLGSDIDLQVMTAVYAKKNGICLRLYPNDFKKENLANIINNFLNTYKLTKKETDLIIDLQITGNNPNQYSELVKDIPNQADWRTITLISGAFPQDLSDFSVDLHKISRNDWTGWLKELESGNILRKPSFGDYTIQHPIYKKPTPGANPSASIRYTLADEWMILRGQALRGGKSAGHAQYPAHAVLLSKRDEFFGSDFSYGDEYIAEKARDIHTTKTGNPTTWLKAGINHHLACTAHQIASLS